MSHSSSRRGRRPRRSQGSSRRRSGSASNSVEARILKLFLTGKEPSLTSGEIAARLGCHSKQRRHLKETLIRLQRSGKLERANKRWRIVPAPPHFKGRICVHPRGFGFLDRGPAGSDLYIPASAMGGAVHKDLVEVEEINPERWEGKSTRARVVKVIEPAPDVVIGTLVQDQKRWRLIPDNPAYPPDIYIQKTDKKLTPGKKVAVTLSGHRAAGREVLAQVEEILGVDGDPSVDALGVIRGHGLQENYEPDALKEAAELNREISADDLAGREDLRELDLFTIDPEDARDFDDAVSLQIDTDGNRVLGVHISDVSHYVRPDTALDREALRRGTSVYFPALVLHMLPPEIATDLCSLRPGVVRLAFSAFLTFDHEGHCLNSRFVPSVIQSRHRFTYREIGRIIEEKDVGLDRGQKKLIPILKQMVLLARQLKTKRHERGALDLEMPEAKIVFNSEGLIDSIELERNDFSHDLIEEFMLAANEAVAKLLTRKKIPLIYRVHEPPDNDSLAEFGAYVRLLGFTPGRLSGRAKLQSFLDSIRDDPLAYTIQLAFLRSLRPAIYSEKNLGHYGLASSCYAYFTSPIRRYPDLMTHRILKSVLSGAPVPSTQQLAEVALQCSRTERAGLEAEREMRGLRKMQYFQQQLGGGGISVFNGVISAAKKYGLVVSIPDYLVSGFLPVRLLKDDHYRLVPGGAALKGRRGRIFAVGDKIRVSVWSVDIRERTVEFDLAP